MPDDKIILTLEFFQEEYQWVGRCPELGTATDDYTFKATLLALVGAMKLHLETLDELGQLDRHLKECLDFPPASQSNEGRANV